MHFYAACEAKHSPFKMERQNPQKMFLWTTYSGLCQTIATKAKTSIGSTLCVNTKSHSGFGQIFNLSSSLSSCLCLSLPLSSWIICHWEVKKKEKKDWEHGSPLLRSSWLHVCDVIITHIKGCALNTATVSFPGGVIKNEQSKPSQAWQKRIKTS